MSMNQYEISCAMDLDIRENDGTILLIERNIRALRADFSRQSARFNGDKIILQFESYSQFLIDHSQRSLSPVHCDDAEGEIKAWQEI